MLNDAPVAFQFPVSPSAKAGIFISAVGVCVAGVIVCWSLPILSSGFVWQRLFALAALFVWALAAAQAWRHWRASPRGHLLWQAGQWAWQADNSSVPVIRVAALDCVWDGQGVVLLRMVLEQTAHPHSHVRSHWLWLERNMHVQLWGDVRRAVIFWQQQQRR